MKHSLTISQGRLELTLHALGACLRSCRLGGRELSLGYATEADYQPNSFYLGVSVGRYANRIAGGRYSVGPETFTLDRNDGAHTLHGGRDCFGTRMWQMEACDADMGGSPARGAVFRLQSPDGDAGFPGALELRIRILATADDRLLFLYEARDAASTTQGSTESSKLGSAASRDPEAPKRLAAGRSALCLTNHAYWNLEGEGSPGIAGHTLQLDALGWFETEQGIPQGPLRALERSVFDFSKPQKLCSSLDHGGVDHPFLLNPLEKNVAGVKSQVEAKSLQLKAEGFEDGVDLRMRRAATLSAGGLTMEVHSSAPSLQVYTGNFLDGRPGRVGRLERFSGICLEAQTLPDSPNQASRYRLLGKELGFSELEMDAWDGIFRPGSPSLPRASDGYSLIQATMHSFSGIPT